MSLNMNGKRMLAEALADAMDRDLTDVPPEEQLEKQHRFSGKFVRRIKRIEAGKEAEKEAGKGGKKDYRKLGGLAKRYSGMAAVLVCVAGLAAVIGVAGNFLRMGASKSEGLSTTGDGSGLDETAVDAADGSEVEEAESADESFDSGTGFAGDDGAGEDDYQVTAPEDTSPADTAGAETDVPPVPDWQEQLLAESAKADELVSWKLTGVYDDGIIELESGLAAQEEDGSGQGQTVRISEVYEVYYEQGGGDWERVYHTARQVSVYYPGMIWGDGYSLEALNMNRAGKYRLVRQVNNYRQVLALTLE